MALFAMELQPGSILAWLVVGLTAGWLADKVAEGGGFGVIGNIVLGLIGALFGGFLFGLLAGRDTGVGGDTGFWGSIAIAFLGACMLLAGARFLGLGRRA